MKVSSHHFVVHFSFYFHFVYIYMFQNSSVQIPLQICYCKTCFIFAVFLECHTFKESSFYNSLPGAQACSWNLSQTNLLITLCDWCCELFLPIIHNQTWPFLFMSKKEILCGFKVYILLWKSKPYCHIDFFLSIHLDIILLHTVSAHVHLSDSLTIDSGCYAEELINTVLDS